MFTPHNSMFTLNFIKMAYHNQQVITLIIPTISWREHEFTGKLVKIDYCTGGGLLMSM